MSENHVVSHTDAAGPQKTSEVRVKQHGSHLFAKLHVFQIALNFPDVERMVTILCFWFRFTRPLKNALLKGFMVCREQFILT